MVGAQTRVTLLLELSGFGVNPGTWKASSLHGFSSRKQHFYCQYWTKPNCSPLEIQNGFLALGDAPGPFLWPLALRLVDQVSPISGDLMGFMSWGHVCHLFMLYVTQAKFNSGIEAQRVFLGHKQTILRLNSGLFFYPEGSQRFHACWDKALSQHNYSPNSANVLAHLG